LFKANPYRVIVALLLYGWIVGLVWETAVLDIELHFIVASASEFDPVVTLIL
jgi:hypothetical protein